MYENYEIVPGTVSSGSTVPGLHGSTASGHKWCPFQLEIAHRSHGKSPQLVFRAGAQISQLLTPHEEF